MSLSSSTLDRPLRPFSQASGHQVNKKNYFERKRLFSIENNILDHTKWYFKIRPTTKTKGEKSKNIKLGFFKREDQVFYYPIVKLVFSVNTISVFKLLTLFGFERKR
jgi:hypothetical protein